MSVSEMSVSVKGTVGEMPSVKCLLKIGRSAVQQCNEYDRLQLKRQSLFYCDIVYFVMRQ